MPDPDALVIGAGPAGLAAAAALAGRGRRAAVLEKAPEVGATWRGHYDRLRLHTVRWLSHLPGLPIPRRAGPWVSRDDFVAYLEDYVRHHRLEVRHGVEVRRVDRDGDGWRIETSAGPLRARTVVVATGGSRVPSTPAWPGREGFTGELVHSSRYRNGHAYRGRDALVVGAGNSGAEIAVDLVESGAARVRVAIRSPPNVVRRTVGGVPSQVVSLLLTRLPLPVADAMARATARLVVGDLTAHGLPAAERGIYTQMVRDRRIPIIDMGLIDLLKAGRVEVVRRVTGFDGPSVLLEGGGSLRPDVVIAATGYETGLGPLVGHLGVLDADGKPRVHGVDTAPGAPGLHFVGFTVPPTGHLRDMRLDAQRIARSVAADRR